jgi:protein-S-isoprenylcysteine O-methyltransferase Ste14
MTASWSWSLVRVVLVVAFVFWCALHLRSLDRHFGFGLPYWGRIPGLLMIAAGSALVMWCGGVLADVGILASPGSRMLPREFVVTGPFRYVRNPMSFGATLLFAGAGLWLRSISILLFSASLFLVFHLVVLWVEEPGLEKRFGNSYVVYKRTVGRWLPRLGSLERFKH